MTYVIGSACIDTMDRAGESDFLAQVAARRLTLAPRGFYWFQLVEDGDDA